MKPSSAGIETATVVGLFLASICIALVMLAAGAAEAQIVIAI